MQGAGDGTRDAAGGCLYRGQVQCESRLQPGQVDSTLSESLAGMRSEMDHE